MSALVIENLRCDKTTEMGHDEVYYLLSVSNQQPTSAGWWTALGDQGPNHWQGADADPCDKPPFNGTCTAWDMNDSGDKQNRALNALLHSVDAAPGEAGILTFTLMESDSWSIDDRLALPPKIAEAVAGALKGAGPLGSLGAVVVSVIELIAMLIPENQDDHLGTVCFGFLGRPDGTLAITEIKTDSNARTVTTPAPGAPFVTDVQFTGDGSHYTARLQLTGAVAQPTARGRLSLQSRQSAGQYVRHRNFLGELTTIASDLDRQDATFVARTGLADPYGVSFEASNYPGYFLRHQDFRLKLQPRDGSALFNADATFHERLGLSDNKAVSYESHNYPGRYIRHRGADIYLDPYFWFDSSFRSEATFTLSPALHG
jgi:hypothetical protein